MVPSDSSTASVAFAYRLVMPTPLRCLGVHRVREDMRVRAIMNITAITKKAYRVVALVVAVWLTGFAGVAMAADRIALVIGNAKYTKFDDLNSPVRDAQAVAEKLRTIGFRLVGNKAHANVDRNTMAGLLNDLVNTVAQSGSDPTVLFYYSGHGASYEKENWLVPVNDQEISYREDLPVYAMGTKTVLKYMPENGRLNIVFLDACRDYALESRHETKTKGSQTTKGLVRIDPSNAVIVYAARQGHVAYDGHGEYGLSPFTEALLARIDEPGKSIHRVLVETARAVEDATKNKNDGAQQPFLSETQLANMNLDIEYFVECPPHDLDCSELPPPPPPPPPPLPKITYENAKEKGTIIAYYSVIENFRSSAYSSMAQQDIDSLIPDHFSEPAVGRSNVLEVAEIKWCLRQREWLKEFHVAATRDSRLNVYNRHIRDYNSRCASYRTRKGELATAKRWIGQHSRWIAATVPNW